MLKEIQDVGGGSVTNDTRHSLARIPLRWMIRQIFITKCGIQFDADRLREIGMDPDSLYPEVKPRPPPLPVDSVTRPETKKDQLKNDSEAILCKHCTPSSPTSSRDEGTAIEEPINEEHEDLHDALCPIYDQLELKWSWWILEYVPLIHLTQRNGRAEKTIS